MTWKPAHSSPQNTMLNTKVHGRDYLYGRLLMRSGNAWYAAIGEGQVEIPPTHYKEMEQHVLTPVSFQTKAKYECKDCWAPFLVSGISDEGVFRRYNEDTPLKCPYCESENVE